MSESKSVIDTSVTETAVQEDYFALRQLKKGAVGWLLLVGLGVARPAAAAAGEEI